MRCGSRLLRAGLLGLVLLGLLAGCRRPASSAAVPPAAAPPHVSPALSAARELPPGREIEAALTAGESHSYLLHLTAGRYAELAVDQRGVDVAVELDGPRGEPLLRLDGPRGDQGIEPVAVIAAATGRHRLVVRNPGSGSGRYGVRIVALRLPTPGDHRRAAAERRFDRGETLRARGDAASTRAALAIEDDALSLLREVGARDREADVLLCRGMAQHSLGNVAEASRSYQEALAIFRALGDDRLAGLTLANVGQTWFALGERHRALDCYEAARPLLRRAGERWGEAMALNSIGVTRGDMGDTEQALAAYEQALAIWRRIGRRTEEATTLGNFASLYTALGEPDKALSYLSQALPILEREGRHRETAASLSHVAVAYVRAGRPRQSLPPLRRALALYRRMGDRREEAITLQNLGWLYWRLGEPEPARQALTRALALLRQDVGDRLSAAATLTVLGDLERERGRPREAALLYRRALPVFTAAGDRGSEADAWFGLAQALRAQGDLAASLRAVETALDRTEAVRRTQPSPELRATFMATREDYYELSIDLRMTAGQDARALAASEESRARSLLEMLAEADLRRGVPAGLLAREAELSRRVDAADRRRRELQLAGASEPRLAAAEAALRRTLAEYDRAESEIRLASPSQAALARPRPLDLRRIQEQVVDAGTVLLEYSLGRERSFLWVVTPGGLASFELPPRPRIEEAARRATTLLAASDQRLARAPTELALAELSRLLLAPAAPLLAGKRLLIVPDGALYYLPFGALPDPAAPGAGLPLAAAHEIVNLPSASTLAVLRRRPLRAATAAVAIVADPVFDDRDPRLAGGSQPGPARPETVRGPVFQRLAFSRAEAESILALAPPAGTFAALDFAASRDTVLSGVLAPYRFVHFATHGMLDSSHPELSGIALSMVDAQGRPLDGFLRAHEIYRLRLSADLVVLSACETALGREIRGEGLVGLTRGFLYAGARSVLVSLWPVEDRATAELMQRFYEALLRRGLSPPTALRSAQDAVRRQPGLGAPYYWAGFVLEGDWRTARPPFPDKPSAAEGIYPAMARSDRPTHPFPGRTP